MSSFSHRAYNTAHWQGYGEAVTLFMADENLSTFFTPRGRSVWGIHEGTGQHQPKELTYLSSDPQVLFWWVHAVGTLTNRKPQKEAPCSSVMYKKLQTVNAHQQRTGWTHCPTKHHKPWNQTRGVSGRRRHQAQNMHVLMPADPKQPNNTHVRHLVGAKAKCPHYQHAMCDLKALLKVSHTGATAKGYWTHWV